MVRNTRRDALKSIGASVGLMCGGVHTVGATESEEGIWDIYDEYTTIRDENGYDEAYKHLEENDCSVANKGVKIEDAAPAKTQGSSEPSLGTQSSYQPHEDVELNLNLIQYYPSAAYVAEATFEWTGQTLAPADVIAITYKENSWRVPQNGYKSSDKVELDASARSANGYAWTYDDFEDNRDAPNTTRSAALEVEPYDDSISEDDRGLWMVYQQNSGPYGGGLENISVAYAAVSMDLSGVSVTHDQWIEDNDGNELKLTQADADLVRK